MVIQSFMDNLHGFFTHAPTAQRSSQLILISIYRYCHRRFHFPSKHHTRLCLIKNSSPMSRFQQTSFHAQLTTRVFTHFDLPLYGLPEAGLHWKTYFDHYRDKLSMRPACHDPCLLYKNEILFNNDSKEDCKVMTCLQTDDTLNPGHPNFLKKEGRLSKEFECKPVKFLAENTPLKLNGPILSCTRTKTAIRQRDSIKNLEKISVENVDKTSFVSQRAGNIYVSSKFLFNLTYVFFVCSKVLDV